MVVSGSVSVSPVWSVAISISVPSFWISFSFGFGFTLLYNMDSSTTVGVVGVWFYDSVGNWGVVVSVWVMETSITTIIVWVGVYEGFLDLFSLYNFFYFFFCGFDCWYNILIVWVPVSVGVWMISCSTMGIVVPRICLGFGLSCGSSEESENYELYKEMKIILSV